MNPWEQFVDVFASGLQILADGMSFLGDHKWAAAIVVFTLMVRTLLLPLAVKQIKSMRAMSRLQPEMKRLQQKYKKDRQRMNQELMELYQREGVNPLGGCLPLVAQFPILIAMFYAIRDLSQSDDVGAMPFIINSWDLGDPAMSTAGGIILLVLMTGAQFLSTRQMQAGQSSQQNRAMQLMPFVFLFVLIRFPAGLVLYWTTQTLYQLIQQTIMLRSQELPEPAKKGKGGGKKRGAGSAKGAPKKGGSKSKKKR